jgi:hypothetical protein
LDQVIFVLQAGPTKHEHICESLELFDERVIPHFAEGREEKGRAKAERLTGMARQFAPRFAFGFQGDIAYELAHHGNSKPPARWTLRVRDGSATALPGRDGTPAITLRRTIPDFARLVTEEVDPQELLFAGRFEIEGDLTLATRVPEMFGAAPRF